MYKYICLAIIIAILISIIIYLCAQLKKEKQQKQEILNQLDFLVHEYVSLVVIDIKNDTYKSIKLTGEVAKVIQKVNTQANFQLQTALKTTCSEEDQEELLAFAELTSLRERIEGNEVISHDFKGKFNGWCRASFRWGNRDKNNVLFMVRQIDRDKEIENELRFKLENDELTGLRNEKYGISDIKHKIETKEAGMFCVMEVDNFKDINDKYGNQIGDEVIKSVADCIKECFKQEDVLIRRGGARYAVFSVGNNDKEDGRFVLKMLESKINNLSLLEEKITISAGVVFNRIEDHNSYDKLLSDAESCLKTSREIDGVSISYYD